MTGLFFGALLALVYVAYLLDWRELRQVMAAGGWASVGVYAVITVFVIGVLISPDAAMEAASQAHH